jgi:hypothetical protein
MRDAIANRRAPIKIETARDDSLSGDRRLHVTKHGGFWWIDTQPSEKARHLLTPLAKEPPGDMRCRANQATMHPM